MSKDDDFGEIMNVVKEVFYSLRKELIENPKARKGLEKELKGYELCKEPTEDIYELMIFLLFSKKLESLSEKELIELLKDKEKLEEILVELKNL